MEFSPRILVWNIVEIIKFYLFNFAFSDKNKGCIIKLNDIIFR